MYDVAIADLPRVLTKEQVAEALQLHPKTVERLARSGKIPSFKVGRSVRFAPEAIAAMAANPQAFRSV